MIFRFYGSCQLEALAKWVAECRPHDNLFLYKNWEFIASGKSLPSDLFDPCDVFIHQPYNGKNEYATGSVLPKIKANQIIAIPFLACAAYWPDACHDPRFDATKSILCPYGTFPQHSSVLSGWADESSLDIENHFDTELEKVNLRDNGCDIQIFPFLQKNWKSQQLFWSSQHPADPLLDFVFQNLARLCPGVSPTHRVSKNLLRQHTVLILDSVKKYLKFNPEPYKLWNGKIVSQQDYISIYKNLLLS